MGSRPRPAGSSGHTVLFLSLSPGIKRLVTLPESQSRAGFFHTSVEVRSCILTSTPVMLVPLVPGSYSEGREGLWRVKPLINVVCSDAVPNYMEFLEFQEDLS